MRSDITITVERSPTINGVEMSVGEAWAQIFAPVSRNGLAVLDCEIVRRSGAWGLIGTDAVHGASMDLYGSQVGKTFSITLRFTVNNETEHQVRFKPVVEINWEARFPMVSQVRKSRVGGAISFQLQGPNEEQFGIRITPRGAYPVVDWTIEPMQYHGDIWAYWPLVIEEIDD